MDEALAGVTPATHTARDADHVRAIVAARLAADQAQGDLRDAVRAARQDGEPWTAIAGALGTTRQAAQQRFGPHL